MISKKQLLDDIITYDVIREVQEDGEVKEYVEVVLVDRILNVEMNTKELNFGLIANKIIENNLYE